MQSVQSMCRAVRWTLAACAAAAIVLARPAHAAAQTEVISDGVIIIVIPPSPCGFCIPDPPPSGGGGGQNDCRPGSIICIHFDRTRPPGGGLSVAPVARGLDHGTIPLARLRVARLITDSLPTARPLLAEIDADMGVLDAVFARARSTGSMPLRDYARARATIRHASTRLSRLIEATGGGATPTAHQNALVLAGLLVPPLENAAGILARIGQREVEAR